MRALARVLLLASWLTPAAVATPAAANNPYPAPDPDEDKKPRLVDSGVAAGRWVTYAERPQPVDDARACSFERPICVHGAPSDGRAALALLAALERAWSILTGPLELPPPDLDPRTLAYDVFLVEALEAREGALTKLEARDVRSHFDRGRAFSLVDRRYARPGCSLETAAAYALARASLARVAPATEEGSARAQATYLAQLAVPCAATWSVDALATFQAAAGVGFADASFGQRAAIAGGPQIEPDPASAAFSAGAALFWRRLDWAFGRVPGRIVGASWALHPTTTPVGAARWVNEPDTFDVLRVTFKGALSTKSTVDDLWLDFAVARAFVGAADDRLHLPELATAGDAGRVPLEWDIPWPSTPRRLAPRRPVHPTGATYVVVRREGAPAGARLRIELDWEEHALFRWALIKIDKTGKELGRVSIAQPERTQQAQMTLVDLDAVDRVLLVGTNVGDPAYAFDPDDEVWEPHGWLLTVAEER